MVIAFYITTTEIRWSWNSIEIIFEIFSRFPKEFRACMLASLIYRIVASTSPSRIEAHAGIFRSLMKGIFDPYVL